MERVVGIEPVNVYHQMMHAMHKARKMNDFLFLWSRQTQVDAV